MSIASTPPLTPAPHSNFAVHVRDVSHRVRSSLADVLASLGIDPSKPQQLTQRLSLDKSLAWKTSRIVTDTDPKEIIERLPGRAGQKILIRSLETAGASSGSIAAVQSAMDEFERLVSVHAGDRDTLRVMLAALSGDGQSERDEAFRKLAFQGNSSVFGVQARVQLSVRFVSPNAANPDMLDLGTISGLVDFRRLRSTSSWALASLRGYHDDGTDWSPERFSPLDPAGVGANGLPVLPAFSSTPLPELRVSRGQNGVVRFELSEGPVGNTSAVTCMSGWWYPGDASAYRTEMDRYGEHFVSFSTPVELAFHDIYVHRSLGFAMNPKLLLYSQLPGGPVYPGDGRDVGLLPIADSVTDLGSPPDLTTPELPRYRQLVEFGITQMGRQVEEFQGYRLRLKYPPIPTLAVFRHDLKERV